jgi:hypothetical protein
MRAKRTLRSNVLYTHCIVHGATAEDRLREIPEDAVFVALENYDFIPNNGGKNEKGI